MLWSALADEVDYIFEHIFWIISHLVFGHETWPANRYIMENVFKIKFAWFGGLDSNPHSF